MRCAGQRFSRRLVLTVGVWAITAPHCYGDLVSAGDLAFIGFNTDAGDDFAIVLLADAAASDVIFFNDNEWVGTGFNNTNEAEFSWTVGSALSAGTVVTFSNLNSSSPTVSIGTLSGDSMSLSSGEAIYAYLGTDASNPTQFLAAITNDVGLYENDGTPGTLDGTFLTQGKTAILLLPDGANLADGGEYTGARSGEVSFADYIALIGNTSGNWDVDPSDGAQYVPFNSTAFTISPGTAVPEPAALSLMFLGGILCLSRRRRSSSR